MENVEHVGVEQHIPKTFSVLAEGDRFTAQDRFHDRINFEENVYEVEGVETEIGSQRYVQIGSPQHHIEVNQYGEVMRKWESDVNEETYH